MRILSVNAWGGAMYDELAAYLPRVDADVVALQEATLSPGGQGWTRFEDQDRTLPQRANLVADVAAVLPDHEPWFTVSDTGPVDVDGRTHRTALRPGDVHPTIPGPGRQPRGLRARRPRRPRRHLAAHRPAARGAGDATAYARGPHRRGRVPPRAARRGRQGRHPGAARAAERWSSSPRCRTTGRCCSICDSTCESFPGLRSYGCAPAIPRQDAHIDHAVCPRHTSEQW